MPAETPPTEKLPLGWPLPGDTKVHAGATTIGPPLIVHVVSVVANNLPVTLTVIPVLPAFGVNVIAGAGTVKVADAVSPAGVPDKTTV